MLEAFPGAYRRLARFLCPAHIIRKMAKKFRMTFGRRLEKRIWPVLLRFNIAPPSMVMLTVRGRNTGRMHSTPVDPVELNGQRYLVAPYGEVQWVRNARAAGEVTLSRGGKSETVRIVEASPEEAAPVLKQYITRGWISRPYFDVGPGSSMDEFAAEAPFHPVFRILQ